MSLSSIANQVLELTRKVAQELSFAEPGRDSGLLPINSFVAEIEEISANNPLPAPLPAAIQQARRLVDRVFDTTALFDASTLASLERWASWMEGALLGVQEGREMPALPSFSEEAPGASRPTASKDHRSVPPPQSGFGRILALVQSIAQELASAEVGSDAGLLPVNSFVYEIEELSEKIDLPGNLDRAVFLARRWMDQILDTVAVFEEPALNQLREWTAWMDAALEQAEQGHSLPPLPSGWALDAAEARPDVFPQIASLAQQLALELAFAEPGKDAGLLPVNNFVLQMEDLGQKGEIPGVLTQALRTARQWLDRIFETTAAFDQTALTRFSEWASWVEKTCEHCRSGYEPQPLPEAWGAREASGSSVPSPAHAPVPPAPAAASAPISPVPAATAVEPAGRSFSQQSAIEPPLELNLEGDDRDLIQGFISESYEHLQNIEQGVLVLEENPTDAATLNSIFRAFHTFKGGAGCVNLTPIKDLAHELESVLDAARQHKLHITTEIINVILEGGDTLGKFVEQIAARLAGKHLEVPICIPTLHLVHRAQSILGHGSPSASQVVPVAQAANPGPEPLGGSAAAASPATSATPSAAAPVAPPQPANRANPASSGAAPAVAAGFVKVDTIKLDALIDLVGELVISESMVVQDPELRALPSRNLARNLGQLHRITSELQRTAMSLRMVPIRATFQKMTRLVRDLSAKQHKQVQLVMSGEDTELDRNIVEEIGDPLVHMIRNAADHGIESAEARVAKGKSATGTIYLRAFHQGGNIVIQIEDDGNGLNKDRLLAKARERGLVKPNETLPDKDIYELIFAAGFSTAEVISDISGRGVGMDVVRQNIEKLRGKVEIQTVPGEGTTFTIYLPLTLAIIDGMIVSVGGQRYIIPTLSVRESFRPKPEMISSVHERGEMVNVRGRLSPLLRLYQYLEQAPKVTDPAEAIIVVVESGQQTRCLMVDELLGKQEVVIKSLGGALKKNHALAGGAVLGDGRVGLILNVDALVKLSGNSGPASQANLGHVPQSETTKSM